MTLSIHLLPKVPREIAEHLGLDVATKLIREYGGTRIWIPKNLTHDHELINLLGLQKAQQLCEFYAGEYLSIDKCDDAIKAIRNQDIARRMEGGETAKQCARRYGLTERQIWNIYRAWHSPERNNASVAQGELW